MDKKRLILGRIPDDFDDNRDVILGAWSLVPKGEPKFVSRTFKGAKKNKQDFKDLEKELVSIFWPMLEELSIKMNRENNTDYSIEFWRMMLAPYLVCILEIILERKFIIEKFIEENQENFKVDILNLERISFDHTHDFLKNGYENIDYHHYIISKIFENLYPNFFQLNPIQKKFVKSELNYDRSSLKFRIKFFLKNLLAISGVYGLSFSDSIKLSLKVKREIKRKEPQKLKYDYKEVDQWIKDFIIEGIPKCFYDLRSITRFSLSPSYKYKIITGSYLYTEEEQKLSLAKYVEKGGEVIPVQHGSNFGALHSFTWIYLNEYQYPKFITWGWDKHEDYDGVFVPCPSPLISNLAKARKNVQETHKVYLVGTKMTPFTDLLSSIPNGLDFIEYREEKLTFFKNLSPKLSSGSAYRSYLDLQTTFEDKKYVINHINGLETADGDFTQRMTEARLVICDHPGTTFHLTMGANIPTIGFWNRKDWLYTDEFLQALIPLKKVGIMHDDARSASEFINSLKEDIDGWWKKDDVQTAVHNWNQSYAKGAENYLNIWKQKLEVLNCN